jgi:Beta-galactosidase
MSFPKFFRAICPLLFAFVTLSPFSVSAQPGSPIRTGLWAMQKVSNDAGALEFFAKSIRANHHLSGVCLHVAWKEVEKEAGKPDFSAIDKFVSVLRGIGMKYQLCLKPGADTPSFVYAQGAQSFETRVPNRNRPDFGQVVVIPVPWDPIYEQNFSKIIAQLGERYASDPLCVSVVLTCANFLSAEMHLPKSAEDLAKWKALTKDTPTNGPRRFRNRRYPCIYPRCWTCLRVFAST